MKNYTHDMHIMCTLSISNYDTYHKPSSLHDQSGPVWVHQLCLPWFYEFACNIKAARYVSIVDWVEQHSIWISSFHRQII